MKELISVIIPVYNSQKYIARCIDSIERQTYTNIEIILVDDGSTDDSIVVIEQIMKEKSWLNIKLYKVGKNKGQGNARNIGLSVCSGEYVLFLDSDDSIDSEMVERMLQMLNEQCDVVLCGFYRWRNGIKTGSGVRCKEGTYSKKELVEQVFDVIPLNWLSCIGTKLYRASIIKSNNLQFSDKYKYNEDLGFILDYLNVSSRVCVLNEEFYCYYYTEGSTQHKKAYRTDCIQSIYNARVLLRETLKKNNEWENKKLLFSNTLIEVVYSCVLCDWDRYSDFHIAITSVEEVWEYSKFKIYSKDSKYYLLEIFRVLFHGRHYRLLYYYIKMLNFVKERKRHI